MSTMNKFVLPMLCCVLLAACSDSTSPVKTPTKVVKDLKAFNILIDQFANNIETLWGHNEILIAGSKDYVKYTDHYFTRSHINFSAGVITIETIMPDNPTDYLRQAIITTLLMGEDPNTIDLYSDNNDIQISQAPFLFGQVLDQEQQPIRWRWRAGRFADYLVANHLKRRQSGNHIIWSVTIKLVANHIDRRASKYLPYVRQAAQKYQVDEALILAIMETESSFNPYAVSRSDALGLMQIMQQTAGRDVFKTQGRTGYPSRSYLFDPEKNIDTGVAYLAILQNQYLTAITHPTSKRYAVISAYNSGAGSVLRVFSNDKERAAQKINQLSPTELYQILTTQHPSNEARNYLLKVNNAHKKYYR